MPAGRMSDSADASDQPLRAIFAAEARVHLAQLNAGLAALAGGEAPAALAPMRQALHTLAGAARAIDLRELEWLCHALERVLGAAAHGARLAPDQLGLIAEAVALAGRLSGAPATERCKRPLTLVGQLDALARALATARNPQSVILTASP
jgi:two-component system chemotaxis sensor kinase CheA